MDLTFILVFGGATLVLCIARYIVWIKEKRLPKSVTVPPYTTTDPTLPPYSEI